MWSKKTQRLCITINDEEVSILALSKTLDIIAHSQQLVENYEVHQSLIANPTKLQTFFHNFLQQHQLKNASAIVLLQGSVLHETVGFDQLPKAHFDGLFDWLQLGDMYWYGVGLSYQTWLQLSLLFMGTDIAVKSMVPYFVVMYNLVERDAVLMLNRHDDLPTMQQKARALFDKNYSGESEKKFLLPGLNALFDS